jgi:hypothetical protein
MRRLLRNIAPGRRRRGDISTLEDKSVVEKSCGRGEKVAVHLCFNVKGVCWFQVHAFFDRS